MDDSGVMFFQQFQQWEIRHGNSDQESKPRNSDSGSKKKKPATIQPINGENERNDAGRMLALESGDRWYSVNAKPRTD